MRAGGRKQKQKGPPAGPKDRETSSLEQPHPSRTLIVVLCLALCLAALVIYAQTYRYGFVAYDDETYVYENPTVKKGLTSSGVMWACTAFDCSNWHPLTWLSHMLDCRLFGLTAGAHHLVNLGFHLANTVLLFVAFVRMTRRPWRSALVTGVFALHPLHVESVAWIAERKDVLSTFLGLVTLLFYIRYAAVPGVRRYVPVALVFALGLMAKPMLVTLPFVFLLLDIWPLRRLAWPPAWQKLRRLLGEKVPLLAMVAAASVVTFMAQHESGAVMALARLSFKDRFSGAAIAYVSYIVKSVWPVRLAVLYPYQAYSPGKVLAALVILTAATAVALAWARRRPYILVGWLWYLGMLMPVIGLVQVGAQSMADRYTYLPLVGLSFAVVWFAADLIENRRLPRLIAVVAACVVLVVFGAQAYRQARYWESSRTLFEHALRVTSRNPIIHNNLGVILGREGKHDEAVANYRKALALWPDYADANGNLGHEFLGLGRLDEAYPYLVKTLQLKPKSASAHADLGIVLAAQGKLDESRVHLEESLRLEPEKVEVHSNLAFVLQRLELVDEAIAHCKEALRLKPESVDAHYNLATAFMAQGKKAEAAAEFSRVLELSPGHAAARAALEQLQKPQ